LYNHKNDLFIPSASIKHQACEKYLYGKEDDIEEILSKLESATALIFGKMIKYFLPPADDSAAYKVLLRYLLYQHSRTTKAGEEMLNGLNKALKLSFDHFYGPDNILTGNTLDNDYSALMTLITSDKFYYLLEFLTCKLMVNLSYLPLITSDAPVITYNRFLEKKKITIGAHGLPAKGLQIFLPIHPRMMVCLFDPAVYNYGEAEQYCITTESEEEIHQFNILQYLNSKDQLFFNEFATEEYVKFLDLNFKEVKSTLGPYSTFMEMEGRKNVLLNANLDPQIELETSFISIREDAMKLNYKGNFALVRDSSLLREPKNE
jgi:Protein of unknown function (DUF4238)